MNVLLQVEEPRPRSELGEWLRRGGHDWREAEPIPRRGEEAWRVDVIVVWLPRLLESALTRCQELRRLPAVARAPILALGTWGDLGEIHTLLKAGVDDYLVWPTDEATLGLRLLVLNESRARHPLTEDQRRLQERLTQTQKLEGLTRLASGIGHDFNNLLAAILGNAELALLDVDAKSPLRHSLEQIEKATRRAAELTRQMLLYSGRAKSETRSLNLTALIEEIKELLRVSISKRCHIEYALEQEMPPVRGDAGQLRQVVLNLMMNASEAMAGSDGTIQVRTSVRDFATQIEGGGTWSGSLKGGRYAVLEVLDKGVGIDKGTRSQIFDPFFTTKTAGRGLGLAAVLGVVSSHQGAIRVDSEMGGGTKFEVYLPVAETALQVEPIVGEENWKGEGTILLIDDEEAVRESARRLLEKAGYTVLAATTGEMGLEIFRDLWQEICAVILDLNLPGMSGEEVFREIKKISGDVRVVVWSGFDESDVQDRLTGSGVSFFIEKPSHVKELALALKRALTTQS